MYCQVLNFKYYNKTYLCALVHLAVSFQLLIIFAKKLHKCLTRSYPVDSYMLKVNKRNIRTGCEICSKLTIKTPEQRQWRHSGVFIVNFEYIADLVLVFLLLTLNM